jgi:hypothetical protein
MRPREPAPPQVPNKAADGAPPYPRQSRILTGVRPPPGGRATGHDLSAVHHLPVPHLIHSRAAVRPCILCPVLPTPPPVPAVRLVDGELKRGPAWIGRAYASNQLDDSLQLENIFRHELASNLTSSTSRSGSSPGGKKSFSSTASSSSQSDEIPRS